MKTLMYAYAVVWAVIFGYLVVQYMRVEKLKKELENIKSAFEKRVSTT